MLLTVPAAVALFFTGTAIVRVFMQGGAFTPQDATITGAVLSGLVLGLPAYVLVKVLTPNFFARKDTRTPVYTAAASLAVTVALNLLLIPRLGVVALAVAGSIGAWFNSALLYFILARRGFYRLTPLVIGRVTRISLASAAMGAALWYAARAGEPYFEGDTLEKLVALMVLIGVGAAVFALAGTLLRVLDKATIARLMQRDI
jgi:putative peptidoglycan lipid II flippase